ncbi:carbohydrate ABC transporter permease [Microbacterium excoecariae]|uniref:carbohydrate ABC transporter permease n=1 Tax=Microbacterium excoecariae TaxID=2715210 RepID=UPI00140E2D6E|nr:sugar ABC transporter permease [Microbacterium excoecariae]NHI17608.1 sugar ABC transporter permease [Microbacterium excoecariae]
MTTSLATPAPWEERERRRRRRDALTSWALLAPTLVLIALLVGYPGVTMIWQSFTDYQVRNKIQGTAPEIVGLDNYVALMTQSDFPEVVARTIGIMVVTTALVMAGGVLVAILMTKLATGMRIAVSVGLLLAWAIPPLTATVVWGFIFDTQYGLVNWALNTLTGTQNWHNHSWLINPWTFFLVLTIIVVWGAIPFVAFTTYAALGQVPAETLEAAQLDGAAGRKRFWYVVFPAIRPVLGGLLILQIIWNMKLFTQVYALQSRGGIAADTNVLPVYLFRQGIGDFGATSAIGVVMVIIMLALSWYNIRLMLREDKG